MENQPTIMLNFFLTNIYEQYVLLADSDDPLYVSEETFIVDERFIEIAGCDYGESTRKLVCETLTTMGVSEDDHESVWRRVDSDVKRMLEARRTTTTTILLSIEMASLYSEEYVDEDADTRQPIPASESSIDDLTRIVFAVGVQDPENCIVCLEEFEDGDDLIQMPCSHLYHQHCIVEWLMTSHLCPLCRYQMPTTQLSEHCHNSLPQDQNVIN
ncbi:hypothetical protein MANES_02G052000v8 [Manihot esculenta]|uniref:RING-type domain-containing protein n=2 Tax=Manihot esculenta TaxID=3983 RepID=A0A2C9WCL4_MANES|nr:hypothetical protein MANES_02G052000v8 [Manihot esculenta]